MLIISNYPRLIGIQPRYYPKCVYGRYPTKILSKVCLGEVSNQDTIQSVSMGKQYPLKKKKKKKKDTKIKVRGQK